MRAIDDENVKEALVALNKALSNFSKIVKDECRARVISLVIEPTNKKIYIKEEVI